MINIYENAERMCSVRAFEESMLKIAKKFRNVVLLSPGSLQNLGVSSFTQFFNDRCFNLGLAEANMTSYAAGFSVRGKIPFIVGISSFLTTKAFEQIRNDICYPNLNIKIIGFYSGLLAGQDGVGCQSLEDIAIMRSLPNMKIICPADYYETLGAVEAMMDDYGPTYLRLTGGELPVSYNQKTDFNFRKSNVIKEGKDICIFSTGPMVYHSLQAAYMLENAGVSTMVVNISSIKPIDEMTVIECSKRVKKCVTVEDHNVTGGLGSAISDVLCENNPVVIKKIGVQDKFTESGRTEDLYKKYGLDTEAIFKTIYDFFESR